MFNLYSRESNPVRASLILLALVIASGSADAQDPTEPRWALSDSQPGQYLFGGAVSDAGDVNNDGYDDVIVGAPFFRPPGTYRDSGQATVFSGLDGTIIWQWSVGWRFGDAVAGAGDVNNDGYDDVIVAASYWTGQSYGLVDVYSGKDGQRLFRMTGDTFGLKRLGASVAAAGDVDGDGYDDFLVGAMHGHNGNYAHGVARVFSGRDGQTILLEFSSGAPPSEYDHFGQSVCKAGDFDGDGVDDFFVGAPWQVRESGFARGAVHVFSGSIAAGKIGVRLRRFDGPSGLTYGYRLGESVGSGDVDNDGYADVIAGGAMHYRVFSGQFGLLRTGFGMKVSGIGDVNGDGNDDYIVGHRLWNQIGNAYAGQARVISGKNFSVLHTIDGRRGTRESLGTAVGGGGDINDDGFPDFIIGIPGRGSGVAEVYLGHPSPTLRMHSVGVAPTDAFGNSVSGAGDVDGDGRDDVIVGSPGDLTQPGSARVLFGRVGLRTRVLYGGSNGDGFGYSVSGAGDVDGDGYDDVIVGAPYDDNNGRTNSGSATVFSGKDLSRIIYSWNGDMANDVFGHSVSGVGDVNGDGYDDVIVGAYLHDKNGTNSGMVKVFSGADGVPLYIIAGDNEHDYLGYAVSGAGDVNGDGFDDLVVGVHGDDTVNGVNTGSVRLISGADGKDLHTWIGDSPQDYFGSAVSGAGDVDADGFYDVIVGAPWANSRYGSARVFSGKSYSMLYPKPGNTTWDGDYQSGGFGGAVSGAGDVNGDGYADLLVGSSRAPVPGIGTHVGSVRVLSGFDGGVLMHRFDGNLPSDWFGASVSCAGDVDGDGLADIIVGSPTDPTRPNVGMAYVYGMDYRGPGVVQPGSTRTYGAGCPGGNNRLPSIDTREIPRVGTTLDVLLRGGPLTSTTAVLFLGASPLSLDLGFIGLPGCTQLVAFFTTVPVITSAGRATVGLPVPGNNSVVGSALHFQWLVLDPSAPYALPFAMSEGLTTVFGR